jgi:ABC-type antimicrobial peptide transport system permease subunit
MLFSEIISTSFISLLVGMGLSIPYTIWILTNETILGTGIISITPDWYWKLPILGIVLGIDVNISSLLSFSKVEVEEAEQVEETRKPFWQRAYLDLGSFGLSIFLWILLRTVPFSQSLREPLTYTIGPIALILLLVSSPLVIARYFSSFIDILSNLLSKISGGLLTLATLNLKKNRYSASKLTALLSIGFMLSLMALTIPYTLNQNTLVEARYDTGADIAITGLDMSNKTQMAALNIDEIEAYSEIIRISIVNPNNDGMGSNIYRYDFLGINTSSITDTLFWEERYSAQTLEEIVKPLEGNNSIGIQSHEKIGLGLDIGDNLNLEMTSELQMDFTIVNEYTYFPRIVERLPWYNPYNDRYNIESLSMVTSINTVKDIISSVGTSVGIEFQGILVKITEDYDLSEVTEKLRGLLGETIQVHSYLDEYSGDFNLPEIVLILSLIEGMLLITIITGVASVLYFSFITLSERKREIGVLRAFGMIRRQIFLLLVIEIFIIVSTGLAYGIGVGYFLTSNFMHLFSMGSSNSAPGFQLYVPFDTLFIFSILTFTLTIISAAIPSFLTARKQTGSILRAE